jgi:ComF family protein
MFGSQNTAPQVETVESISRFDARSLLSSMTRFRCSFSRGLLDLVYPDVCLNCNAEVNQVDSRATLPFCAECLDGFKLFDESTCARCGAPPPAAGPVYVSKQGGCYHCAGRKLWFDRTIAAGQYSGTLRDSLLRMKHALNEALSLAMGRLIVEQCREQLKALEADVVVPVPMHWRRRLARGTNSAALLAEPIARELSVPMAERLLRRFRHTPPQSGLSPAQRRENVRRVFGIRSGYYLTSAHVVLVDDILTTGATCSEAAHTLRKAGADRVTVIVAARALAHS